jgi:hypothetical protein
MQVNRGGRLAPVVIYIHTEGKAKSRRKIMNIIIEDQVCEKLGDKKG